MEFIISKIKSIKPIGIRQTYDIEMPKKEPSYIANKFVVHNSVGDACFSPKIITENLRKLGFKAAALTDHGTLAGVLEFQRAMLEKGLKPIIGCEIYCKFENDENRYHFTVLVKNEIGWKNILKLQAIAVRENFYYKPLMPFIKLIELHEGLIITSGCSSGKIYKLLDTEKNIEAEKLIKVLTDNFKEDFYFEIQPHNIENNQKVMQKKFELSKKFNVKCIFATDTHYCLYSEEKYHQIIKAIDMKKQYGEAGYGDDCFFLMQEQDIIDKLKKSAEWMLPFYKEFQKNTFEIVNKCNFKIEPPVENDTLPKYKPEICKENFEKLYEEFIEWKKNVLEGKEKLILSEHEKVLEE